MILIIDFGSQYNQLIARRVRENRVYCRIEPPQISVTQIKSLAPQGIILSGGPSSIYTENSPKADKAIFELDIPILGICYGMQYMVDALGGTVKRADKREYGFAELTIEQNDRIFTGLPPQTSCWMSHGDSIIKLPDGFATTASTDNAPFAAIENRQRQMFGLQFHPEVAHTPLGSRMLKNFLFDVCDCRRNWTMKSFAKQAIEKIKKEVGDQKVILGLSGGVDSSVTAVLIHKAIGPQLTGIFVDNGVLRQNEREKLEMA